jgi:hypothetical protein
MKNILDQMEEHIAAIRNLQRNFDFHSKRLEKLMKALDEYRREINCPESRPLQQIEER